MFKVAFDIKVPGKKAWATVTIKQMLAVPRIGETVTTNGYTGAGEGFVIPSDVYEIVDVQYDLDSDLVTCTAKLPEEKDD